MRPVQADMPLIEYGTRVRLSWINNDGSHPIGTVLDPKEEVRLANYQETAPIQTWVLIDPCAQRPSGAKVWIHATDLTPLAQAPCAQCDAWMEGDDYLCDRCRNVD